MPCIVSVVVCCCFVLLIDRAMLLVIVFDVLCDVCMCVTYEFVCAAPTKSVATDNEHSAD